MVSLNVMFDWDTRIVIFDLEDLIEKQLQKNLLQVSDNQKYKFKLQLPYSYSVNTRLKYFPGYKKGSNALMDIPRDYQTSSDSRDRELYNSLYNHINIMIGRDLSVAMNNLGYNYNYDYHKIKYIECINCNGNKGNTEIAFIFVEDPQKQEARGATTEKATGATDEDEARGATTEKATGATGATDEDEDEKLRVGGRKSTKRRKSTIRRKNTKHRRKSTKRRKSLK